ncbi:MAG: F420-dependent NADP oxidoreductase [Saprospiraceae bacterium]|nr:F420-dependent NADP oxidoreductase [Saprospiraceae bacterium]
MTISIIGTGNIAFHLGKRLKAKGIQIKEIIGRDPEKASGLANLLDAAWTTDFTKVKKTSDLYLIAVNDSAIENVAFRLSGQLRDNFVVHTSGTTPSTVLKPYFKNFGTLWPLQTFSLTSQPDFEQIPIFINSTQQTHFNDAPTPPQYPSDFLRFIAEKISPRVYELSDADKMTLHLAAVFVNNFTNHLFKIGADIVQQQQLPFDVLLPLIEETVNKIRHNDPDIVQTGPARRGDDTTIARHLDFLEKHTPQYDLIYTVMSIGINKNLGLNK